MKEVAVLVASHGRFAEAALESAEMIVGKQENCGCLSVEMDVNLKEAIEEMQSILDGLETSAGTVVLVDLFGGTPSNVSGNIVLKNDKILAISGLNLPMLIQLLLNRHMSLDELAEDLEKTYLSGFTNITEVLSKEDNNEDECEVL
ncbi:PTS sugar transporter subunit IIA [Vagococcus elongatus]|uniref:PTS EIIA type-4 domain-containing protein n=1 Tax=Vagococcus elongatus TaxID=180344 RepID=A0A430AZS2_9ENTE|nr:PTS sugar transporter subunit IIA [Vagococcus elongatus]RSU13502.1 hypothetical protein CBF29_04410 [Vagococcus elongatus]